MPTSDRSMNPTMQTQASCLLTAPARLQKRKMSGYQLRPRAPQPTVRVDFAAAIRIVGSGYFGTAVATNQVPRRLDRTGDGG
jgi:hypothetical protein